jgi:prohibitin 1
MYFIIALVAALAAFAQWRSYSRKPQEVQSAGSLASLSLVIAVVALLFAAGQSIRIIPAGHVGVIDFLGNVSKRILPAGVSIMNPMARAIKYSIQTKEHKEKMEVLSQEGLTIGLEISVLYRLNPDSAASVYQTVAGGDYENIILIPQFRSICRAITASFKASALYSNKRDELGTAIQKELAETVASRGVIIENTPLRDVVLPKQLTTAIEQKQKAEQESQRMEFVLTKEKKEAQRKRIEAQGIADFQKTVSAGISQQLLQWKGIEATQKLAESSNAKVVIVGAGKGGLPVILNTN